MKYMVSNGNDAFNFLNNKGEYKGAPTPDIILLDLNLPDIIGFEVLKKVKNDEKTKKIEAFPLFYPQIYLYATNLL